MDVSEWAETYAGRNSPLVKLQRLVRYALQTVGSTVSHPVQIRYGNSFNDRKVFRSLPQTFFYNCVLCTRQLSVSLRVKLNMLTR